MDIKEYISSGILEEYVLGSLSEQERQEVECLVNIYPELKEEMQALQVSFGLYIQQFAVKPPESAKEKIAARIKQEKGSDSTSPADFTISKNTVTNKPLLTGLAIAASIALLVSLFFTFRYLSQNTQLQAQLDDLEMRFSRLSKTYQETVEENEKLAFKAKVLVDPTYKIIPMPGVEDYTGSLAHVYWDTETKDVYVGVDQLPLPPEDKQYQLWAIVDGEAVDAGVFEVDQDTTGLQKMKNIQRAEAFVVTLEKRGGVPVAEGDIYVMGNV